jgi:hypothetical protein
MDWGGLVYSMLDQLFIFCIIFNHIKKLKLPFLSELNTIYFKEYSFTFDIYKKNAENPSVIILTTKTYNPVDTE